MDFGQAVSSGFRNYANFAGRAARSEYWYWALFYLIAGIITAIVDAFVFPYSELSPLNTIAGLGLLLPSLAVLARRLHDIDRTAWWLLLSLTVIGTLVLLYWACVKGTDGPNQYGPDPLTGELGLARP